MSAEIVVGMASAAVSVVGAVAAGLMTTWSAQRTRRYEALIGAQQKAQSKAEQAEAVISRYREPLLAAAQNLHSRLYNIVENDTLAAHLHCGDPELEDFARDYTIYVLAEYLCWAEIVRRDMRFLDLGGDNGNREFVRLLEINQLALSNAGFPQPLGRIVYLAAIPAWASRIDHPVRACRGSSRQLSAKLRVAVCNDGWLLA